MPVLDHLERRQWAAELLPLRGVGAGHVEHRLDHPDVLGGQRHPAEGGEHGEQGFGLLRFGDEVCRRALEVEPGLSARQVEHLERSTNGHPVVAKVDEVQRLSSGPCR